MSFELFKHSERPDEFAVSKTGTWVSGSIFYLDFSRPLEVRRWFGIHNRRFGFAVGLLVPVIHEADSEGGYVVSLKVGEPYFEDVRKLWRQWYPRERRQPNREFDGLKIIADFAQNFPEDSRL